MKTAFIIYIRAVGIYAIITFPAMIFPIMYLMSMQYVLLYGWFAWAFFTIIYLIAAYLDFRYLTKMTILSISVVASVALAFQMLEMLHVEDNIWHSGFLAFPLAAVIAGWISLIISRRKIKNITINQNDYENYPVI